MVQTRANSRSTCISTSTATAALRVSLERALRAAVADGRLAAGRRPSAVARPRDRSRHRAQHRRRGVLATRRRRLARRAARLRYARGRRRPSGRRRPRPRHRRTHVTVPVRPTCRLPRRDEFPPSGMAFRGTRGARRRAGRHARYGPPRVSPHCAPPSPAISGARAACTARASASSCARVSARGLRLVARRSARAACAASASSSSGTRATAQLLRAAGLTPVPLEVDGEGAVPNGLDGLGAVLLTAAHQFPLGVALSARRRAAFTAWAARSGAFVVEDDYDGEFRYDRRALGAVQALAPEHVVYAGTASKTLAPGLRLGWLVLPESLLAPVLDAATGRAGATGCDRTVDARAVHRFGPLRPAHPAIAARLPTPPRSAGRGSGAARPAPARIRDERRATRIGVAAGPNGGGRDRRACTPARSRDQRARVVRGARRSATCRTRHRVRDATAARLHDGARPPVRGALRARRLTAQRSALRPLLRRVGLLAPAVDRLDADTERDRHLVHAAPGGDFLQRTPAKLRRISATPHSRLLRL